MIAGPGSIRTLLFFPMIAVCLLFSFEVKAAPFSTDFTRFPFSAQQDAPRSSAHGEASRHLQRIQAVPNEALKDNPLPKPVQSGTAAVPREDAPARYLTNKTPWEVWLTLLTTVLAISCLWLFCWVHKGVARDQLFSRNFITVIVIFSALFLIVAGYSEKQTAPVYGLLGSILGYIFGLSAGEARSRIESAAQQPPRDDGRSGGANQKSTT